MEKIGSPIKAFGDDIGMKFMRPLIIAHRGYKKIAPENTLAAIQAAIDIGADGIETDVHLTKDGVPILCHDEHLTRLVQVHRKVWDLTWDEIKKLPFPFTDLDSALKIIPQDFLVNIEIKNEFIKPTGIEKKVVNVIKKYPCVKMLVSSFNPFTLWRIDRLKHDIEIASLFCKLKFCLLTRFLAPMMDIKAVNPAAHLATNGRIKMWKEKGYKIFVWTINTPEEWLHFAELGVTGIITDNPVEAMGTLK